MEALTYSIGLRMTRFGSCMLNVVYSQVELVVMLFNLSTIFSAAVSEDPQHGQVMLSVERQYSTLSKSAAVIGVWVV